MPSYAHDDTKEAFRPHLLKTLKGKSCVHIKTDDAVLMGHIADALAKGHKLYRERQWADRE